MLIQIRYEIHKLFILFFTIGLQFRWRFSHGLYLTFSFALPNGLKIDNKKIVFEKQFRMLYWCRYYGSIFVQKSNFSIAFSDTLKYNHSETKKLNFAVYVQNSENSPKISSAKNNFLPNGVSNFPIFTFKIFLRVFNCAILYLRNSTKLNFTIFFLIAKFNRGKLNTFKVCL